MRPVALQRRRWYRSRMPGIRQWLGARGERLAARYLRRRGFAIVARNFRGRAGEIDLVGLDGDVLVFVEVKTRSGERWGRPDEAVDRRKQRQMERVAEEFVRRHRLHDRAIRFDVVAILAQGWRWRVQHYPNAFERPADFWF